MTLHASFDCEVVPRSYERWNADDWAEYDHTLRHLGTKLAPQTFPDENVQVHPDGLATEYAPLEPLSSSDEFLESLIRMHQFSEMLTGIHLVGVDWVDISQMPAFAPDTAPLLWELAHTLGCSEDFDQHGVRNVPQMVKDSPIKEVGFHIHIDVHPKFIDNHESVLPVVQDYHDAVGFLLPTWTASRPPWYRAPMTYRPKPYGLEYRSFGASIIEDKGRIAMLARITFDFMRDHYRTHNKRTFV